MNLLPPPVQGPYESLDGAIASLNVWAASQGYAIVKSHTKTYVMYVSCNVRPMRGTTRKRPVRTAHGGYGPVTEMH
jgi:hypothetical protein